MAARAAVGASGWRWLQQRPEGRLARIVAVRSAAGSMLRRASHRGLWYASDPVQLSAELDGWLSAAGGGGGRPARAVIVPHAGYEFAGSCSAHAFAAIDPARSRRVFILGPSHYTPLKGCCLPVVGAYETPDGGALRVDAAVVGALRHTQHFDALDAAADEEEHSVEMQLPFIAKVMDAAAAGGAAALPTIVPVIVGAISPRMERIYGEIFGAHLRDPCNLFVVSSDFCHWGAKFHYTVGSDADRIDAFIASLDRRAMDAIEALDAAAFRAYLAETRNTICGRNAIAILLSAIAHAGFDATNATMKFLNYKQSSRCRLPTDSCVSYASAVFTVCADCMSHC